MCMEGSRLLCLTDMGNYSAIAQRLCKQTGQVNKSR